jgi:tetratricopeptide (TPR) repeat protein
MDYEDRFSWRLRVFTAVVCLLLAVPGAFAQTGRFAGVVLDDRSQPLRGATIRAENSGGTPAFVTSTSDAKGQFYFIGLRSGQWKFTVEAPGFLPTEFSVPIRAATAAGRPVGIKLQRNAALVLNGPLAGVDAKLLRADLAAADDAFAKGDFDSAIINYRAVLLRAPALTLVNLQIGNAYRQKKDNAKAAEAFESVLKAEPANAAALYDLGEIRRDEGQLDQARGLYEKAAVSAPTWTRPVLRLGMIANEKGDRVTALAQLKKVMTIDPDSPDAAAAESLANQMSK